MKQPLPQSHPIRRNTAGVVSTAGIILAAVTLFCVGGVAFLLLRPHADPGIRVWVLNHTPDQVVIFNPFNGTQEKSFQVADGLKQLAFSRDYTKAYIINVVDVSNRIKVLDTRTFLTEETIEIDGVPQGIGVFPDNRKLVLINASKTDFMAGGFDVIDLYEQSKANPKQKKRLYRERTRELVNQLAVGDDGDRIYVTDSKSSELFIYSLKEKKQINTVDMHGSIENLYYPTAGKYYYISVLQHMAIYQLDKRTDELVGAYIYEFLDARSPFHNNKLRQVTIDAQGEYLVAPISTISSGPVAVWHVDDTTYSVSAESVPTPDVERMYRFQVPYYLPCKRFGLVGGYDPSVKYVPTGKQVGIDSQNQNLFIMDEDGALYIFELRDLGIFDAAKRDPLTPVPPANKKLPQLKPYQLITDLADKVTEIRDMQVSRPAILNYQAEPDEN